MFKIIEENIQKSYENGVYNLRYPYIESKNKFISKLNDKILDDIKILEDITKNDVKNLLKNTRYLYYISSEYDVFFNKNNILSIYLGFYQLAGRVNISYVKTYNYDLSLEKEIELKNLFKKDFDFKNFIKNLLKNEQNITINIYDDISFCFNDKELLIYFSSYELDFNIKDILYISIDIKLYKDYLSDYFISLIS